MSMLVAIMIFPCINCQAYTRTTSITNLEKIMGNWYDSKGNLALTIGRDYTINGCQVIAAYFTNEFYSLYFGAANEVYRIIEKNGYRDINFEHYFGKNGNHEMLIVDGKNTLRRTKEPRYLESIGGIYLGMDKDQIVSLYGQPSKIETVRHHVEWNYDNEGFNVHFVGNVVDRIKIYPNGNRRFDRTGLSARDSKETFKQHYNAKNGFNQRYGVTDKILDIGNGEEIYFDRYPQYIMFTVPEVL